MGLSSFEAAKLTKLKPIKIRTNLLVEKNLYNPYLNSVNVAVDNFTLENINLESLQIQRFLKDLNNHHLMIKASNITLHDVNLSRQELLFMFSPYTVSFHCSKLKISSIVTFSQILRKIPNIEDIGISKSDVKIENSWPDDLMKLKNGNYFKRFDVKINTSNFDIKTLASFMKVCSF